MKFFVFSLLMCSCGQFDYGKGDLPDGKLGIAWVDPELEEAVKNLRISLPGLFKDDPHGVAFVIGDTGEPGIMGFWNMPGRVIVVTEPGKWITMPNGNQITLPLKLVTTVVAHELGHAFGLDHTASGLMAPTLNGACIGREAECLRDALDGR